MQPNLRNKIFRLKVQDEIRLSPGSYIYSVVHSQYLNYPLLIYMFIMRCNVQTGYAWDYGRHDLLYIKKRQEFCDVSILNTIH